jgi:hypothetical protein
MFAYLQEGSAPAGPYISTAGYQVPASGLKGGPQYFSTHELGHSDVKVEQRGIREGFERASRGLREGKERSEQGEGRGFAVKSGRAQCQDLAGNT